MNRFANWRKTIFVRGTNNPAPPDKGLDQALEALQAVLLANRKEVVFAICQLARIRIKLEAARQYAADQETSATNALKQGDRSRAQDALRQKEDADALIETLQDLFDLANLSVEQFKIAIKRQEDDIRRTFADSLTLKAQLEFVKLRDSIPE